MRVPTTPRLTRTRRTRRATRKTTTKTTRTSMRSVCRPGTGDALAASPLTLALGHRQPRWPLQDTRHQDELAAEAAGIPYSQYRAQKKQAHGAGQTAAGGQRKPKRAPMTEEMEARILAKTMMRRKDHDLLTRIDRTKRRIRTKVTQTRRRGPAAGSALVRRAHRRRVARPRCERELGRRAAHRRPTWTKSARPSTQKRRRLRARPSRLRARRADARHDAAREGRATSARLYRYTWQLKKKNSDGRHSCASPLEGGLAGAGHVLCAATTRDAQGTFGRVVASCWRCRGRACCRWRGAFGHS